MPSVDDVETVSSDATGAAPPATQVPPDCDPDIGECIETVDKTVDKTVEDAVTVDHGEEVDGKDDKKGNLYEDTFNAEDGQKVLPEPAPADELVEDDGGVATVGGKKRKSKSIASRGPTALPKNRGTGFEEFYAEPPLTPDEYEEEMDLYHATLNFDERIETCIQRYRARRRLDNDRTKILNNYLKLGGINCEPRMFNGAAGFEEGETMTKDDVRALTATDVVDRAGNKNSKYYAADNAELWTVDFTGVASGFLSVTLRSIGGCEEKLMKVGIDVVDNFLRYLQIHDVCPEYDDDIKSARKVCETAHKELPNLLKALPMMPGQFNLACTKWFCSNSNEDEMQASPGTNFPGEKLHDGLNPLVRAEFDKACAKYFFITMLGMQSNTDGDKEAVEMAAANINDIRIIKTREMELEITEMKWLSPAKKLFFDVAGPKFEARGIPKAYCMKPAGTVVTKRCRIEEGIANQPFMTEEEEKAAVRERFSFFLDYDIMDLLCPGMKMRVVLHELNCGINFVSMVKEILPSFFVFLPQELMSEWKTPEENEREGPSVDNPDAEAEQEVDFDDNDSVVNMPVSGLPKAEKKEAEEKKDGDKK